ncbi:hypothetical protein P4H66_13225 [Paenibacillus dokdonensis]|uniref:Uncharacterized protein n=1 Tax=Paenibacillus dokdonensis TaxID=2567944 RepID=A0ABU6GM27_9BACL|nr:hypothetical protein [Paenibacillus dokdonensis]MEC0240811.1 hypothetical protein [Paenibacillus dokdonensis]
MREILSGKKITKEQYDLYLELVEKEKSEVSVDESTSTGVSIMASNVNPKNCTVDVGKNYCFRIDSANTSTGEPYHVAFSKLGNQLTVSATTFTTQRLSIPRFSPKAARFVSDERIRP